MNTFRYLLPFFAAVAPLSSFGLTHSRTYQWGFQAGNLLSNWSFENRMEFWKDAPVTSFTLDAHYKASGNVPGGAMSGSYVARITALQSTGNSSTIVSDMFPVLPNMRYTLSFYYQTSGSIGGSIHPSIWFYSNPNNANISGTVGTNLSASSSWTLYTYSFVTPSDIQYAQVSLAEFNATQTTLYLDNVGMEEWNPGPAGVLTNPANYSEAVAFGDGLGRSLQTQTKSTKAGTTYLVQGVGLDSLARPETSFVPIPYALSVPAYQSALLTGANSVYGSNGPYNAHGYPFSRVKYSDEPGSRVVESGSQDSAWRLGGVHTVKQGFYFTNDSLVHDNIENPTSNPAECKYILTWSKSPDSTYSLTWTNKLGQVIRKATNVNRSSSSAASWKWSTTHYEYYPNGALQKINTPLDDSSGTTGFAEVTEYDAQGQLVSTFSPDRNLRKSWYNRQGILRYTQDEEQRSVPEFTYYDYDDQGRLISQGIQSQIGAAPPQDSIDQDTYSQGVKLEQIGYIYDDTATFHARTGFSLSDIMGPASYYVAVSSLPHHLFCKYNRNADNPYSRFSDKDKFVADFFSYDDRGNLFSSWKYIGPIRNPEKRLQDAWYLYDVQNRVTRYRNYAAATSGALSSEQSYAYDYQGRVDSITGLGGRSLAKYSYGNWGPLESIRLGGLPSGDSSTVIDMGYQSHGGLAVLNATGVYGSARKRIFSQFLGYEGKAYDAPGVPALLQPKFDGSISQQVYKFTSDLNALKPVRAVNYGYDQMNRMLNAQGYVNTNANPLDGQDKIDSLNLTMAANDTLSTRMEYDLNGRITGQRIGGVASVDSAKYYYPSSSYELDRVVGKLSAGSTRPLSSPGTFGYDYNGAMIQDKSKKLGVRYGWDGLPVSQTLDSSVEYGATRCCVFRGKKPLTFKVHYPSLSYYHFYDADGNRVSRIQAESRPDIALEGNHYVFFQGRMVKEWHETYYQSGLMKDSMATASIWGVTAQIGRIRQSGAYDFYLKNHLGSTMYTVDDRGRYLNGRVEDYQAYGSYKDLKVGTSDPVTQKWTGKENEALTGLYAFGARFYDPELALWLSPDAVDVYANPYVFGGGAAGGDPVNYTDPDGNCPICVILVIAAVGAYMGGSAANGTYNPTKWDYENSNTYIGMGAGAVIGAASGGAGVAGVGLLGAGSTLAGGALLGAGIGGGVGLGMESYGQEQSGDFSVGGLFASAGAGAAVGGAAGALFAGSSGAGFLGLNTPGLFGATNGMILGGGTAAGGLIGGGIGTYYGNTSEGILRGGATGFFTGAAVIGGAYAYSYVSGWAASHNVLAPKLVEAGMSLKGPALSYMAGIGGQSLAIGAGALGASIPLSMAYLSARGTQHFGQDYHFAERQKNRGQNFYDGCIDPIFSGLSGGKKSTKSKDSNQPPESVDVKGDCGLFTY